MNFQTLNINGKQIFKMQFSEISDYLEEKGFNVNEAFEKMADENEMVYVSNGFVLGLKRKENDLGEWHHYFKMVDGRFQAVKFEFAA